MRCNLNFLFLILVLLFFLINSFLSCLSTCSNVKCHQTIFSLCLISIIIHRSTVLNWYLKYKLWIFRIFSWNFFVYKIFSINNFKIFLLHHFEIQITIILFCKIKYLIPFVYFSLCLAIIVCEVAYNVSGFTMVEQLRIF
jgi:hypothetical protein